MPADLMHTAAIHAMTPFSTSICCVAVDPHRDLHDDTPFTSAAIASLGHFLPSMLQASDARSFIHGSLLAHVIDSSTARCMSGVVKCDNRNQSESRLLKCLVHVSLQRRLTFQWDLWSGRPLISLKTLQQATCRFLLTAAASLTTCTASPLRQASD